MSVVKAVQDGIILDVPAQCVCVGGLSQKNPFYIYSWATHVSGDARVTRLARDLGLRELYLWPVNADQQGTPQQVRKVIDGIRQHRIPAVFCESTVNNDPARQVARETGARYGGSLYVDSLSTEDGPVPTYLDLLRVTTTTIVTGLSGAS